MNICSCAYVQICAASMILQPCESLFWPKTKVLYSPQTLLLSNPSRSGNSISRSTCPVSRRMIGPRSVMCFFYISILYSYSLYTLDFGEPRPISETPPVLHTLIEMDTSVRVLDILRCSSYRACAPRKYTRAGLLL